MTKTQIANYRRFVRSSAKREQKPDASFQIVAFCGLVFVLFVIAAAGAAIWRAF